MANDNFLTIIVLIALVIGGIFIYNNYQEEDSDIEYEGNEELSENSDIVLEITYYDINGDIVGTDRASQVMAVETVPARTFAKNVPATAVNATINIVVSNTGNVDLDISVSNIIFSGNFIG